MSRSLSFFLERDFCGSGFEANARQLITSRRMVKLEHEIRADIYDRCSATAEVRRISARQNRRPCPSIHTRMQFLKGTVVPSPGKGGGVPENGHLASLAPPYPTCSQGGRSDRGSAARGY